MSASACFFLLHDVHYINPSLVARYGMQRYVTKYLLIRLLKTLICHVHCHACCAFVFVQQTAIKNQSSSTQAKHNDQKKLNNNNLLYAISLGRKTWAIDQVTRRHQQRAMVLSQVCFWQKSFKVRFVRDMLRCASLTLR